MANAANGHIRYAVALAHTHLSCARMTQIQENSGAFGLAKSNKYALARAFYQSELARRVYSRYAARDAWTVNSCPKKSNQISLRSRTTCMIGMIDYIIY